MPISCALPACAPAGARRLNLKGDASDPGQAGRAVFLDGDRSQFEAAGHSFLGFGMRNTVLGLVCPVIDTDGDGLMHGMEQIIGTSCTERFRWRWRAGWCEISAEGHSSE